MYKGRHSWKIYTVVMIERMDRYRHRITKNMTRGKNGGKIGKNRKC